MKFAKAAIAILFVSVPNAATTKIVASGGWFETAWAEWEPAPGVGSYEVRCTAPGTTKYVVDATLVRKVGSRMRVDVPGLAAGSAVLEVLPVSGGKVDETSASSTSALAVRAHVREGFAFQGTAGAVVPGAYDGNGRLKAGAATVAVDSNNVNTVALDVVVDAKGNKQACKGLVSILDARSKGFDKTPLAIRVTGLVRASRVEGLKDGNFLNLQGANSADKRIENITIEGIGKDATLHGYGICLKRSRSIEIRNLAIMLFGNDAVSLDTDNENIWIHNNDFFYGAPGADADQVKGDGTIDMKYNSTRITISFNHFWDTGKSMGCGGSTETVPTYYVSFHHNWFDHSDSRNPRLHYATAHVYNNYFDGVSVYAIGNTTETSAFVESNVFRNVPRPMMISGQGTDAWDATKGTYTLEGTFSGQDGGMTKAFGNLVEGSSKLVFQTDNATQFDAWNVKDRSDKVPSTTKSVRGGWAYSNFDTDATMYAYTPDPATSVKDIVTAWAGRISGGDLQWHFVDSVDDANHEVNVPLKAALTNYVPTGSSTSSIVRSSATTPVSWTISGTRLSVESSDGSIELRLLRPDGTTALYRSGRRNLSLELGRFQPGVYAIRIRTEAGFASGRIVVP